MPKITTRWIWRPTTKFTSIDQAYLFNGTILFILLNHLGHRFGQQWTTLLDIASMLAPCPGLTMCSGRRQDFVAGQGSLCFAVKYEWSKTFVHAFNFLFNPILWFVKVDAPEGAPATYTNYWGYEIDLLYSIGKISLTYHYKA